MFTTLRARGRLVMYHSHRKRRNFFEDWYFRLLDAAELHVYAIIPGAILGSNSPTSHSFVQLLDGLAGYSIYHPGRSP